MKEALFSPYRNRPLWLLQLTHNLTHFCELAPIKRNRSGQIASSPTKGKTPETVEIPGFWAILALAELRRSARGLQAVLLALLHAGIAGQEPGLLQQGAVLGVHQQQSAADAVAQGAGLAGHAAALDGGNDVHLAQGIGGVQGLTDDHLQGLQAEVLVDIAAVDGDAAGAVGEQVHAGHGGLTTASAVHIGILGLIHSLSPPYLTSSGF